MTFAALLVWMAAGSAHADVTEQCSVSAPVLLQQKSIMTARVDEEEDMSSLKSCIDRKFLAISRSSRSRSILHVERNGHSLYDGTSDRGQHLRSSSSDSFEIMSITKAFVGTVINQLMDEGKIWYKDPFTEYMPTDIPTNNWCSSGSINSVRVVDLLNHKSGFKDLWDFGKPGDNKKFEKAWNSRDSDAFWTAKEILSHMHTFDNKCESKAHSYADTNFVILGVIIEHIEGTSLHVAIRQRILNKVGMPNTFMLYRETNDGRDLSTMGCNVQHKHWVGDGWCDKTGGYNTPECSFDGGDCCPHTCRAGRKYRCEVKGYACAVQVDSFVYNGPEGGITTGQRRFSADWGGSGYVSTAQDLAKFIRTWAKSPQKLFWVDTSFCRVLSKEMLTPTADGDEYSMGFELTEFMNGQWGYGHTGYTNSFMFYVEKTGVVITGTLNDYMGENEPEIPRGWTLVNSLVEDCLQGQPDASPPHMNCPGHFGDQYMSMSSWEGGSACDRACNAWDAAGWSKHDCMNKCTRDRNWDDQYVTCLQRHQLHFRNIRTIQNNKCEAEPPGCYAECSQRTNIEDWWKCIPRCEGWR